MAHFSKWLDDVGKKYTSLSDSEKNETLDHLIEASDAAQLYHLSEKLDRFLKRDFIVQLPQEITFYLLSFLDAETLTLCCEVSQTWEEIITSCREAWKSACYKMGALVPEDSSNDSHFYKELYQLTKARVNGLRDPDAFDSLLLYGHSDRVMAVYYRDGKLATGTDKTHTTVQSSLYARVGSD